MPQIMRSEKLLICDDDVIPGHNFIQFFLNAHRKDPFDVLCARGNIFLPHKLPQNDCHEIWTNYDCVRFVDDFDDECFVHYVHACTCLIPKVALREVSSIEPPDESFWLVDDYWLSYVLSSKFNRSLRKLRISPDVFARCPEIMNQVLKKL